MLNRTFRSRLLAALALSCSICLAVGSVARASCGELVNGHLGWIETTPITSLLFWPPMRGDAAAYLWQWAGLLNNASFYGRVAEYGVKPGSAGDLLSLSSAPTGDLDESTIQYALYLALVGANRVPKTGESFVIFLPQGTRSKQNVQNVDYGHHSWLNATFPDGKSYTLLYAVIEYFPDARSTDIVVSHELYEIYTDPIFGTINGSFTGLGWWDESNSLWTLSPGGARTRELADLCVNHYYAVPGSPEPTWTLNGATLQQLWSQKACQCQ